MKQTILLLFLPVILAWSACSETPADVQLLPAADDTLAAAIDSIASEYDARIGVAVILLDSGHLISVRGQEHFTLMSVVKFPQAIAILKLVDQGKIGLNDKLHFTEAELKRKTYSPLRDKMGSKPFDLTLRETLEYAVGSSDNVACDKLYTLLTPAQTDSFYKELGFTDIEIALTYAAMTDTTVNKNWTTPGEMAAILTAFAHGELLSDSSTALLMDIMINTGNPANRIKGQLPADAVVAHKTGTMSVVNGSTPAFNDVGVVTLPDGRRYAIAVFVNDSKEGEERNAEAIARISRAAWDHFVGRR